MPPGASATHISTLRADTGHSLRLRDIWSGLAKAAVHREVELKNAATDQMAGESPYDRAALGDVAGLKASTLRR